VFFEEAISSAKALDEHLQRTGKTKGPLHGLPISLKDNFNVKGKDSTVGFTSLVGDPAAYNSTLVDLLADAGAVFYVKTNVPTAMMIVCFLIALCKADDWLTYDLGRVGQQHLWQNRESFEQETYLRRILRRRVCSYRVWWLSSRRWIRYRRELAHSCGLYRTVHDTPFIWAVPYSAH